MSSRSFRKKVGSSLPPPNSDSDSDFDPPTNRPQQRSTYEGLELSSSSESESQPESQPSEEDDEAEEARFAATHAHPGGARKKVMKPKKAKGKKTKAAAGQAAPGTSASASAAASASDPPRVYRQQLDEIDKSIMEVNALLGAPKPVQIVPQAQKKAVEIKHVLAIEVKHLNVANELRRLFGPEDPEEVRQRNKTQPHRDRLLKRVLVRPTIDTAIYDFKKTGLTMSIESRSGDILHFVYDHDVDHQKLHNAFLLKYAKTLTRQGTPLLNVDDARKNMHVEHLLEIADTLFRMDEYSLGNQIIENVMTYLQCVAHPSFNLASRNVRLSYRYLENRPFHVAMFKYMYLLTNKACHRTALEIAKMMLNIDPDDPLAVLFVIDTLALRAREHQWLLDAVAYFNQQRQANMLLNIQYSFALAHFHVATKNKKPLTDADKYLQDAIISYPEVVIKILEFGNTTEPRIQNHNFFKIQSSASASISELIMIYAKLTWPRWREPQVLEWFIRNAVEISQSFDSSQEIRDRAGQMLAYRNHLFQMWPTEILRHIAAIRPMANLLMEVHLSPADRPTSGWDPILDHGFNRYSYRAPSDPPMSISPGGRALLYEFFTSIMPNANFDPELDD